MVALFCAAILSQAADFNQRPLHFGFSAAGSYIGIWHLDDEVLVKKETDTNDDGSHFYREQSPFFDLFLATIPAATSCAA